MTGMDIAYHIFYVLSSFSHKKDIIPEIKAVFILRILIIVKKLFYFVGNIHSSRYLAYYFTLINLYYDNTYLVSKPCGISIALER